MLTKIKSKLHMPSVAYAATNLANGLLNSVFMFYYVKVFLNRYHVDETWFQVSQVVYMIWNAVNDPLFGYIQDNYDFSWVKTRRHSVLYGAPFFALGFLLPWFPWADYSNPANSWICGLHLMFALCFYDTMFTFVLLAQCAIFAEMSQKQEDRLRLVRYSQTASMIGSSAVFFCETISRHQENYAAFQATTVVIAVIAWLCMRYTGTNAHTEYDLQKVQTTLEGTAASKTTDAGDSSVWRLTWQILKERDFLSFVLTNFCQIFHYTFLSNFVAIICDSIVPYSVMPISYRTIYYGALFLLPQLLLILGTPIVGKFGYYKVIRTAFYLKIVWGLFMYFMGVEYYLLFIIFFMLDRCGAKISFSLFNMPLSDIIDNDAKKYARQHPLSSMVFGTNALITKPAISVAPMVTVWILNRYGYEQIKQSMKEVAGLEKVNLLPSDLRDMMFTIACMTPVIIGILQLLLWSRFTIRQQEHIKK